jgi:hypothetical protein
MLISFPLPLLVRFEQRFCLTLDYASGLTNIKNKTPGNVPGVCL